MPSKPKKTVDAFQIFRKCGPSPKPQLMDFSRDPGEGEIQFQLVCQNQNKYLNPEAKHRSWQK